VHSRWTASTRHAPGPPSSALESGAQALLPFDAAHDAALIIAIAKKTRDARIAAF